MIVIPRQAKTPADAARWVGMDHASGRRLAGLDHLRQSINDILTTRIGERIMRPEYGVNLLTLIDRPVNSDWLVDLYFVCALAITRWEPRVRVLRVLARIDAPGHVSVDLAWRFGALTETQTVSLKV